MPMSPKSPVDRRARVPRPRAPGVPVADRPVFPEPRHSTGTVDDDDEPEDEHDGENEAGERATSEYTEAPEEFERDDEDRH